MRRLTRTTEASRRRGLTLIELLVTIAILLAVTAVTIPLMQPNNESRRIRESARLLTSQIAAAQAQAMTTGRPVGIWIQRLGPNSPQTHAAMAVSICETPPIYAGETADSRVSVSGTNATFNDGTAGTLKKGDSIRFNFRGPYLPIDSPEEVSSSNTQISFSAPAGYDIADVLPPTPSGGVPFQIQRQPAINSAFRAASNTIQFPDGAAIDLLCSGIGTNSMINDFANGSEPIIVLFGPTGEIVNIQRSGAYSTIEDVYLLIGNVEHALTVSDPMQDKNVLRPTSRDDRAVESLWVTINARTGLVTTVENVPQPEPGAPAPSDVHELLSNARQLAQTRQSIGGR